jgi:SAM-dependent methyltransferase
MSFIENIHGDYVSSRRGRRLSDHLVELVPQNARVLDVGCGDGFLASLLIQRRPDIDLRGIDKLVRDRTYIPVKAFDGQVIPYSDASFDVVMFVDVLHHTENPMGLLREAIRVARRVILIKDHTLNGLFAGITLRFMDYIGNARYGVALPYNYWPRQKWIDACDGLRLKIGVWRTDLRLYPWPTNHLFDRSLHFVARLDLA